MALSSCSVDGTRFNVVMTARMIYFDLLPAQLRLVCDSRYPEQIKLEFWTVANSVIEPPAIYSLPFEKGAILLSLEAEGAMRILRHGNTIVFVEAERQREVCVDMQDLAEGASLCAEFLRF